MKNFSANTKRKKTFHVQLLSQVTIERYSIHPTANDNTLTIMPPVSLSGECAIEKKFRNY